MKRMRLRPSLGQLRLQREARDAAGLGPQVDLCVEPEQLRAALVIRQCKLGARCAPVQLELSFPPQYPHRPPKVVQAYPSERLPCWAYNGDLLVLPRLTEQHWRPAMGVSDIALDLLRTLGLDGGALPPGLAAAAAAAKAAAAAAAHPRPLAPAPAVLETKEDEVLDAQSNAECVCKSGDVEMS